MLGSAMIGKRDQDNSQTDEFLSNEFAKMARLAIRVADQSQHPLDYAHAILSGVSSALAGIFEIIAHPVDNVLYPAYEFLLDASIISSAYAPPSTHQIYNSAHNDIEMFQQIVNQNPKLYHDAVERMQQRINMIKAFGIQYENATPLQKAEMEAKVLTSVLIPGTIFKALKNISNVYKTNKLLSNPTKFDPKCPPNCARHENIHDIIKNIPKVKKLSLGDIREIIGPKKLIYVITESKELIIAEASYLKQTTSGNLTRIFTSHAEVAELKPVISAGDVIIENGKIINISPNSGHTLPNGIHLKPLTEQAFLKEGFVEASGKFISMDSMNESATSGLLLSTAPLLNNISSTEEKLSTNAEQTTNSVNQQLQDQISDNNNADLMQGHLEKLADNNSRYGMVSKPIQFPNKYPAHSTLRPKAIISFDEFRKLKGDTNHIYVVTVDGQVFMSKDMSDPDCGEFMLHHSHLAGGVNVVAAGKCLAKDGKIIEINEDSGHHQPCNPQNGIVAETAFINAGYTEAEGKYKSKFPENVCGQPKKKKDFSGFFKYFSFINDADAKPDVTTAIGLAAEQIPHAYYGRAENTKEEIGQKDPFKSEDPDAYLPKDRAELAVGMQILRNQRQQEEQHASQKEEQPPQETKQQDAQPKPSKADKLKRSELHQRKLEKIRTSTAAAMKRLHESQKPPLKVGELNVELQVSTINLPKPGNLDVKPVDKDLKLDKKELDIVTPKMSTISSKSVTSSTDKVKQQTLVKSSITLNKQANPTTSHTILSTSNNPVVSNNSGKLETKVAIKPAKIQITSKPVASKPTIEKKPEPKIGSPIKANERVVEVDISHLAPKLEKKECIILNDTNRTWLTWIDGKYRFPFYQDKIKYNLSTPAVPGFYCRDQGSKSLAFTRLPPGEYRLPDGDRLVIPETRSNQNKK